NTNTHVALDIIIQNKYIKDDNGLLDLFNKTGYDRSLQGIKQMIYELTRCGLITRNNFNDLRPTENALTIPKISDKKNQPDESAIEQCLKLIDYLENNELFIKNTIIAFSKNLKNNREILDYLLALDVNFKSDDHSHIPAMKNFLVYLGILNETGDFTNLGSKILNNLLVSYWQIAPGENARLWPGMKSGEYVAVGWKNTPNLSNVKSKEELFQILKNYNFGDSLQETQTSKLWQFLKEIKVGDKLVINKGKSKIIGIGEVIGDYYFEQAASEYKHRKKVRFTWTGEVDVPFQGKFGTTLVELSKEEYDKLTSYTFDKNLGVTGVVQLLQSKKQIILYGPPGTGKTYKAREYAIEFISKNT
ncbi:MAG: EVE domain-containing protein, partial [Candidatus Methanofastidiosum sp.]|nr:EVE domain-containing protein [Methanofastidiosum sp.]